MRGCKMRGKQEVKVKLDAWLFDFIINCRARDTKGLATAAAPPLMRGEEAGAKRSPKQPGAHEAKRFWDNDRRFCFMSRRPNNHKTLLNKSYRHTRQKRNKVADCRNEEGFISVDV